MAAGKTRGRSRGTSGTLKKSPPTDAQIISEIGKANGLVSIAARRLGMGRSTLYRRIESSRKIREAIVDARETMKDVAESALQKSIAKGEPWAVCFYLKTQAKDRGYIERQEVAHSGSLNLTEDELAERERRLGLSAGPIDASDLEGGDE